MSRVSERIIFEELPNQVIVTDDGRFALQSSVDFAQFVRLTGGWINRDTLELKRAEGFFPSGDMWVPISHLQAETNV